MATKLYPKWKELLVYEEDGNEYAFECGWGVTPGVVYVAAAEDWEAEVPAFLKGRRDEMLTLLREKSGHTVEVLKPRKKR